MRYIFVVLLMFLCWCSYIGTWEKNEPITKYKTWTEISRWKEISSQKNTPPIRKNYSRTKTGIYTEYKEKIDIALQEGNQIELDKIRDNINNIEIQTIQNFKNVKKSEDELKIKKIENDLRSMKRLKIEYGF